MLLGGSPLDATVAATSPPTTVPGPPTTDAERAGVPPVTANDFLPEDRDVTDCIGVLERPGCGNENRGGWRQYAVLGVLLAGLLVVFGNIARGVRRRG